MPKSMKDNIYVRMQGTGISISFIYKSCCR